MASDPRSSLRPNGDDISTDRLGDAAIPPPDQLPYASADLPDAAAPALLARVAVIAHRHDWTLLPPVEHDGTIWFGLTAAPYARLPESLGEAQRAYLWYDVTAFAESAADPTFHATAFEGERVLTSESVSTPGSALDYLDMTVAHLARWPSLSGDNSRRQSDE